MLFFNKLKRLHVSVVLNGVKFNKLRHVIKPQIILSIVSRLQNSVELYGNKAFEMTLKTFVHNESPAFLFIRFLERTNSYGCCSIYFICGVKALCKCDFFET